MDFAEKVKYVRNTQNMSQEDFAYELGVSFATINRWENGNYNPSRLARKSTIINGERILSEDILFASSSSAAKFVAGSSVSGNVCWKNADGILLKNLQKGE